MTETVFEDDWLRIVIKERKPKTIIYGVQSKCSDCELGEIKWYPQWRHYCFVQPTLVFSGRCLLALGKFVEECNKKHRGGVYNLSQNEKDFGF